METVSGGVANRASRNAENLVPAASGIRQRQGTADRAEAPHAGVELGVGVVVSTLGIFDRFAGLRMEIFAGRMIARASSAPSESRGAGFAKTGRRFESGFPEKTSGAIDFRCRASKSD